MKKLSSYIFTGIISCLSSYGQTVGLIEHKPESLDDGYVLFAPNNGKTTYLIDKCGQQIKTWTSKYKPGQSVYILPDGTLLHTGNASNTTFVAGGQGGIIEKIDWNGNVTWTYTISDATKCQHHDVKALPNGNVLIIAWESKTNTEAIAAGRTASLVPAIVWSEQILEVKPNGATGGTIVWEWHLWDHIVQDTDPSKPNFGVVASSPKLIDINFNASATNSDWIHLNSIDYNAALDQILVSAHNFDEIWIIDHSTTTSEAASHSGGKSGNGGDIIYRWGNPLAYAKGTTATQKLFGQHNAHWIESGLPYENKIMIFNNGVGRPGGNYSTVEIISPPVSGFNYTQTLPYLPTPTSWNYNNGNPRALYSMNISGTQQLPNGNVLICSGSSGTFTEVTSTGTQVWKYINPANAAGAATQNTTPTMNSVFRCVFYPSSYSGFTGKTLTRGTIIENSNTVSASCMLTTGIESDLALNNLFIYPNPFNNTITIQTNSSSSSTVEILNTLGQIVAQQMSNNSEIQIDLSHLHQGLYFVKISNENNVITREVLKK